MFLVCSICKHSIPFTMGEGAPSEDLYKCRKSIPVPPTPERNATASFPIVEADWECNKYQKEMGS